MSAEVKESTSIRIEEFFNELKHAVEVDRVVLPTLPEVAISIRDAVECSETTTRDIAEIISIDPAISTRLIKVVNSPLYRGVTPIDDLHTATTRLGGPLTRDIVTNLAIKQLYQPTSGTVETLFRKTWSESINVSAICGLISHTRHEVRQEQALLAGLIHNIGALPLLTIIGSDSELFDDLTGLNTIIRELQGRVGALMLENWDFPDELITVVKECHNFDYARNIDAPLLDIVQVALFQAGHAGNCHDQEGIYPASAFSMLGLDPSINITQVEENRFMLAQIKQTLSV